MKQSGTYYIPSGPKGMIDLVAMAGYPLPKSAAQAVNRIHRWADHGHHHHFGRWHSNAPRPDNKTYADYQFSDDYMTPMSVIAKKFEEGVTAGKAFMAFLSLKMGDGAPVNWDWNNRSDKSFVQIALRPTDSYSSADDKHRYRQEWGKWKRTVHVGAAFYSLLRSQPYGENVRPRDFCRTLLENLPPDHLPHELVKAANGFRAEAIKFSIFPKARDPFIRLIAT